MTASRYSRHRSMSHYESERWFWQKVREILAIWLAAVAALGVLNWWMR